MIVNTNILRKLAILALIIMSSILSATTIRKLEKEHSPIDCDAPECTAPECLPPGPSLPPPPPTGKPVPPVTEEECVYPELPEPPVVIDPPYCTINPIHSKQLGLVYNEIAGQINSAFQGVDIDRIDPNGHNPNYLQSRFEHNPNGVQIKTESRFTSDQYIQPDILHMELVINTYNKDKQEALQDNLEARNKLLALISGSGIHYSITNEYAVTCLWISLPLCFGYWRAQKRILIKVFYLYNVFNDISIWFESYLNLLERYMNGSGRIRSHWFDYTAERKAQYLNRYGARMIDHAMQENYKNFRLNPICHGKVKIAYQAVVARIDFESVEVDDQSEPLEFKITDSNGTAAVKKGFWKKFFKIAILVIQIIIILL